MGSPARRLRLRWWDTKANTYRKAAICEDELRNHLPDTPIPEHVCIGYQSPKPLFIGHYWLSGKPAVQSEKVACLDYGAANEEPLLVAYRWNGEAELSSSNLIVYKLSAHDW